ncbi:MAG: AMP-binding protein, partial [Myxococcota bacterium]
MTNSRSLVHQLADHAAAEADVPAIFDKVDGSWQPLTWGEYWTAAREVASGLLDLGLQPGDAVALIGPNRRDWAVCQLGIWAMGGLACPIYATSTEEQAKYIAGHGPDPKLADGPVAPVRADERHCVAGLEAEVEQAR